ncbi:MAG: hypothetical protein ACRD2J_10260 [Thermoanaerobaculia bacterium]
MTIAGWIFLLVSLTFVWGLCAWCFIRVVRHPGHFEPPPDSLGG